MKKKLLMLGGADIQVPAITMGRELGWRVITCDYLPDNPGHALADEYHNVSTTDLEGVLTLARQLNVQGVSAYGSDPAALTAAYLTDRLGLPGNSFEAVRRLQDKVLFRRSQHQLGIPAPRIGEADDAVTVLRWTAQWPHGAIIKPVDTSGSKGIARIVPGMSEHDVHRAIGSALEVSRAKQLVLEEYLPRIGAQITGEVLIVNGRVVFYCFGDVHFNDRVNGLVPRAVTIPCTMSELQQRAAMDDLQRMIDHLGVRSGVFNVDVITDPAGRAVMLDIGARNGGNMIDEVVRRRTGVDLTELSLRLSMGEKIRMGTPPGPSGAYAHAVVHALGTGTVREIKFSPLIERVAFHKHLIVQPGSSVCRFDSSAHRAGLLLMAFASAEEMGSVIGDIYSHVEVRLDPVGD